METITLSEIGKKLSGVIETFSADSDGNTVLVAPSGKKFLLKGAIIRKKGGHVTLKKDGEIVYLRLNRYIDKKKLSISAIGLFVSLILGLSVNVITMFFSGKPPETAVAKKN